MEQNKQNSKKDRRKKRRMIHGHHSGKQTALEIDWTVLMVAIIAIIIDILSTSCPQEQSQTVCFWQFFTFNVKCVATQCPKAKKLRASYLLTFADFCWSDQQLIP